MIPPMALPPPSHELTIEAVEACGVNAANVGISYDQELQSDVVTIGTLGGDEEAKVGCLAQAVHPFYHLEFNDAASNATYWKFVMEEGRRRARLEGRQWLQERGLLRNMPRYRPGGIGLASFVRNVEAHCSVKPGRAIEILTPTSVTLRVGFMQSILARGDRRRGDRLTCLMNVLAASDLAEGGVEFGFFGNEAIATEGDER